MRLWWLLLLAGCACPQPQQAYQQRVPPSVYHAPPWMYSTVLRKNKQGKMERVRVRVPRPEPVETAEPHAPPRSYEIYTAPDPKIEADLNDLAGQVDNLRRKMSREPSIEDVRQ